MSFANEDLRAEELAEGVWALRMMVGANMVVNCGLIDLGGTTVAWDTGAIGLHGQAVREVAISLTGRPPDSVILSHPHPDHYGGANALPESLFISTAASRAVVAEHGTARLAGVKGGIQKSLDGLKAKAAGATDPAEQAELARAIQATERAAASFATEARLPALTAQDSFTLHGTRRSAEFRVIGHGHSPSDGVLYLPAERILFGGDVALPAGNLFLNVGGVERSWPELLDRLLAIGAERLVPGHGEVGPVGPAVELSKAYLADIFAALEEGMASGEGPAWADRCTVPERWAEMAWRRNLKGMLQARLA